MAFGAFGASAGGSPAAATSSLGSFKRQCDINSALHSLRASTTEIPIANHESALEPAFEITKKRLVYINHIFAKIETSPSLDGPGSSRSRTAPNMEMPEIKSTMGLPVPPK